MFNDTSPSFVNPLRIANYDSKEMVSNNSFGAIVARAGGGKTALIVQVAIDAILQGKKVLHVSLSESVNKVGVWYEEVLANLTSQNDSNQIDDMRKLIQDRRLILTLNAEKFNFMMLQKKIEHLTEEQFFQPTVIIIDGLFFDISAVRSLKEFKKYSQGKKLHMWFTVTVHRNDKLTKYDELPVQLVDYFSIFDTLIVLRSRDGKVFVELLKGKFYNEKKEEYILDASTMLVKNI